MHIDAGAGVGSGLCSQGILVSQTTPGNEDPHSDLVVVENDGVSAFNCVRDQREIALFGERSFASV